ncbi:MAG TPA: hypothetical protein VN682_21225 [Terriglobales bacterium]|nr:hypothetical protein [Terriglobales bacterium]
MTQNQGLLARRGLTLPKSVLRRLNEVGIFVQPYVSLEHQHLTRRYVVRGIESGGAVKEVGRYVAYCGSNGESLPYVLPIDSIGVNGVHAVVIAPVLVRVELFRIGRTCQLLITRHEPGQVEDGRRPPLENKVLFRGVDGFLDAEQDDKRTDLSHGAMPQFWSRAGEEHEIPALFAPAVRAATLGSKCFGCAHMHFSVAPVASPTQGGARVG